MAGELGELPLSRGSHEWGAEWSLVSLQADSEKKSFLMAHTTAGAQIRTPPPLLPLDKSTQILAIQGPKSPRICKKRRESNPGASRVAGTGGEIRSPKKARIPEGARPGKEAARRLWTSEARWSSRAGVGTPAQPPTAARGGRKAPICR